MTRNSTNQYPTRTVRDTRVSAFTYETAIQYLKEQNHLYRDLTWEVWTWLCHDPNAELLQAVDEYFMPAAYAELEQKYSNSCEKVDK